MIDPTDFSWLTAMAVFATYVVIDVLYAMYVLSVGRRQPLRAAAISSLLYTLLAWGVLTYSANAIYLVPLAIGAFVGTYVTVKAGA
jgi:hypothetical protein